MHITQLTSLIPRRSLSPVTPRTRPQLNEKVQPNLQNVLDTWGLGGKIVEYLDNPSVRHLMLTSTGISESKSGLSFFLSKIEDKDVPKTASWTQQYLHTSNTPSMDVIYTWRNLFLEDYLKAYVEWKGLIDSSERHRDIALYIASSDELRLAKDMSGKSVQEFISTLKKYYFLAHAFPKTNEDHLHTSHASAIQSALRSSGATNLTPLLHTLHRDAPSDLLESLTDELISLTLGANDLDKNLLLSLLVQGEYFETSTGTRPEIWLAALNSSDPEINSHGAYALRDGRINNYGFDDPTPIHRAILHMITNSPTDFTRQNIYEFVSFTNWPFDESGTTEERNAILSFLREHTLKDRDMFCCAEYLTLLNTHFEGIFGALSAADTVTYWLKLSTNILNRHDKNEETIDNTDTTEDNIFNSISLFGRLFTEKDALLSDQIMDTLTKLISTITSELSTSEYYDRRIWDVIEVIDKLMGDNTQNSRFDGLQKEKKRLIRLHIDELLKPPSQYHHENTAETVTITLIDGGYFHQSLNKIDKDLWLAAIQKCGGRDIKRDTALVFPITRYLKNATKEQKITFSLTKELAYTIKRLCISIRDRKTNPSMSPSAPSSFSFEETKEDAA